MKKDPYFPALTKEYLSRSYDSMDFTLATGQSDYDVAANVTGAFENVPVYTTITIRSDKNISIKINATTNRAISIIAGRPFELDNLVEITNIYITNNSGATASIQIIGVQKG